MAEQERITVLLHRMSLGDRNAEHSLYAQAATRLKRISQAMMSKEVRTGGFQASDLVQEAYVQKSKHFRRLAILDGDHFFALMTRGMKQILIDRARSKAAIKRVHSEEVFQAGSPANSEYGDLSRCLQRLKALDPNVYLVLRLRNDEGLKWEEIAGRLGRQPWQVRRDFAFGLQWLREQMS